MSIIKNFLSQHKQPLNPIMSTYETVMVLLKNLESNLKEYVTQMKNNKKTSEEIVDVIMLNLQNIHYFYDKFLNHIKNSVYFNNVSVIKKDKLHNKVKLKYEKICQDFFQLSYEDSNTNMIKYQLEKILKVENSKSDLSNNT